jgi:hypothetical protein
MSQSFRFECINGRGTFLFTASVSAFEILAWSAPPLPRAAGNSNGGDAAIDRKFHARDEACFIRSEEQGGRCDLLRKAEPPERDGRGELGAGWSAPSLVGACWSKMGVSIGPGLSRSSAFRASHAAAPSSVCRNCISPPASSAIGRPSR